MSVSWAESMCVASAHPLSEIAVWVPRLAATQRMVLHRTISRRGTMCRELELLDESGPPSIRTHESLKRLG